MRITKVVSSFGYTANMGQYESARAEFSLEAEVQEGEDPQAVMDDLHVRTKEMVRRIVLQQRKEGRIQ